jgi:hypothetical protein
MNSGVEETLFDYATNNYAPICASSRLELMFLATPVAMRTRNTLNEPVPKVVPCAFRLCYAMPYHYATCARGLLYRRNMGKLPPARGNREGRRGHGSSRVPEFTHV